MRAGELTIIGQDFIEIILDGRPLEIIVEFLEEDIEPVPSNPHHHHHHKHGKIKWQPHHDKEKGQHKLIIEWEVIETRRISWKVRY